MNGFKNYHPIVNFTYFVFVIGFSMFFMNPICLALTIFCGFTYAAVLGGVSAVRRNLLLSIPVMLFAAVLNPMFSHEGVTTLAMLPSGNPLTLESLIYGCAAGAMIASVILWFSCYNQVMTTDKFVYLFGRIIPSMSLVFSMTLRFVPRFGRQLAEISNARRCIGRDASDGSLIRRLKHGLDIISVLVTRALENSVETADSMKARGYGLPGRTAFSIFTFDSRDKFTLLYIVLIGTYILIGAIRGKIDFSYFPAIKGAEATVCSMSIYVSYFALCITPIVIEVKEALQWKAIKSKI